MEYNDYNKYTTLRVLKDTRDMLRSKGSKGDTYDDILSNMCNGSEVVSSSPAVEGAMNFSSNDHVIPMERLIEWVKDRIKVERDSRLQGVYMDVMKKVQELM